jgi:Zn-dependent protease
MWLNVLIAVFNLIPAFPLDGGLMFRATLSKIFGRTKAVSIQFYSSIFIAGLFLAYSYWQKAPEYIFFSWLIYFTSRREWLKSKLRKQVTTENSGN